MKLLALLVGLGILVFIHELGHFFFARLFKTRVEKFYLFFNPWFSLMRMKKMNGKREFSFFSKSAPESWAEYPESTEWGIGWLPLGGYCSISGMVDETKTAKSLGTDPQPWEYRSKPAWQRFFIIIGGVLFNFISAIILYGTIFYTWGETYVPIQNAKYGFQFSETAQQFGFKNGDKILKTDSILPIDIQDFSMKVMIDNVKEVTIQRDTQIVTINISEDFARKIVGEGKGIATYQFPFVVEKVMDNTPAQKAGFKSGDSLIAVNGFHTIYYTDYQDSLLRYKSKSMKISVFRSGQVLDLNVRPDKDGKIGVQIKDPISFFETKTNYFNFIQSIPKGINYGIENLGMYIKQFKLVFTKEGATKIGGFASIAKMYTKQWDWANFWEKTAFLSIILAFMNIIPIPALDGGYILFIIIEMITRRKPSDKFIGYANYVGFALLMILLIYANGMDIIRGIFK
jgi:regulator of sigma E protease